MNNYPDNAPASMASAPWHEDDPLPVQCPVCLEPPCAPALPGDPCQNTAEMIDPKTGEPVPPCDGRYEEVEVCSRCGLDCDCP